MHNFRHRSTTRAPSCAKACRRAARAARAGDEDTMAAAAPTARGTAGRMLRHPPRHGRGAGGAVRDGAGGCSRRRPRRSTCCRRCFGAFVRLANTAFHALGADRVAEVAEVRRALLLFCARRSCRGAGRRAWRGGRPLGPRNAQRVGEPSFRPACLQDPVVIRAARAQDADAARAAAAHSLWLTHCPLPAFPRDAQRTPRMHQGAATRAESRHDGTRRAAAQESAPARRRDRARRPRRRRPRRAVCARPAGRRRVGGGASVFRRFLRPFAAA